MLGFARDILIAAALGASAASDAFFVAFKIPNFFRRLTAEGAFNSAFLPTLSGLIKTDKAKAKQFADDIFSVLLYALVGLSIIFILAMPYVMYLFAPGFEQSQFELATNLARITFVYVLFISLVALYGAILNSFEKFAAVAATPILLNLSLIFSVLVLDHFINSPAYALAVGVFIAGIAQFFWAFYFVKRDAFAPDLKSSKTFKENENIKKFLKLFVPAAIGSSVVQLNLFVDMILASTISDAVSYLYYADRIYEFPLALIGIAIGTALLPSISKEIKSGASKQAAKLINDAAGFAMFLCIPAAFGILALADPIMITLFEYGAFDRSDALNSAAALKAFAFGLPAFVLVKITAPIFYANDDTKTPFKIAGICVGLNFALNIILMQFMAHVGLALATSIAAYANFGLLYFFAQKNGWVKPHLPTLGKLVRIFVAALFMGGFLHFLYGSVAEMFDESGFLKFTTLFALILLGIFIYMLLAFALKLLDKNQVAKLVS